MADAVSDNKLCTDGVLIFNSDSEPGDLPTAVVVDCVVTGSAPVFLVGAAFPVDDGPTQYDSIDDGLGMKLGRARAFGAQPWGTGGRRGIPVGGLVITASGSGATVRFQAGRTIARRGGGDPLILGGPRGYPLRGLEAGEFGPVAGLVLNSWLDDIIAQQDETSRIGVEVWNGFPPGALFDADGKTGPDGYPNDLFLGTYLGEPGHPPRLVLRAYQEFGHVPPESDPYLRQWRIGGGPDICQPRAVQPFFYHDPDGTEHVKYFPIRWPGGDSWRIVRVFGSAGGGSTIYSGTFDIDGTFSGLADSTGDGIPTGGYTDYLQVLGNGGSYLDPGDVPTTDPVLPYDSGDARSDPC